MSSINIPDVLGFFAKAEALLQALIAGGVIKTSSGTQVATILGDVTAVVSGAQQPSTALVGDLSKLLTDLGTDGVINGSLVTEITAAATKFAAVVSDIQGGQAGLLGTGDLVGKHGSYLFVADGGAAAQALGL